MKTAAVLTILIATLTACGSDSTGPTGELYQGEYSIGGGAQAPAEAVRFRVVSQTADRLVLDWIEGDVRGELPVRDTALWNEDAYRVDWREGRISSPLHIVRLTGSTCIGRTFYTLGDSRPWGSCTLSR